MPEGKPDYHPPRRLAPVAGGCLSQNIEEHE